MFHLLHEAKERSALISGHFRMLEMTLPVDGGLYIDGKISLISLMALFLLHAGVPFIVCNIEIFGCWHAFSFGGAAVP